MAKSGWWLAASLLAFSGTDAMAQGAGGLLHAFGGAKADARKDGAAWIVYESAAGGFSVLMPGKPKVASQAGKPFTTHTVHWEDRHAKYSITYFDPPPKAIAPDVVEAAMKKDRDLTIRDVKGSLVSEKRIALRKDGEDWPGLASVIEDRSHLWSSRLFAVDGRMYALMVGHPIAQDRPDDTAKFFDSFVVKGGARP